MSDVDIDSSFPERAVAQLGRALEWGSRGRWFESSQPEVEIDSGNEGLTASER